MKHSHLRGLKLLFCATLALAIVLSLLPAQEAKALTQGQTCPDCGTGKLIPINYTSEQHAFSCSKTGCIHSKSEGYIWENHHGGITCTGRPICEGCGREYGSPDPEAHNWDTKWSYDETNHYHECLNNGCTAKNDEAAHSGGTATCQTKAVCATCGQSYGTVDTVNGHNWDTNWSYDETNHYHKCLNDGCTARKDEAAHSGGAATCVSRPICDECGQEYGSVLGHDWQTEWTIDGGAHYHACSRCTERKDEAAHNYVWTYLDDSTHKGVCACGAETTEAHYDRWASSCGRQPHCEKCDHNYDTIQEHEMWYEDCGESGHKPSCYHCDTYFFLESHTYGDWQDNGDGTHTGTCVCGRKQTEGHVGGTDTCTEGAKCSLCGAKYGNPLGHDLIDHEAQAPSCTAIGWDAYQTCSRCDYTTYTEKKALGHDLIDHAAQAPTCTAIGWDAYQTCSRCDYTTYTEKKALGHDLIGHDAKAPTCTAIGWDAYQTCSRCDYTTYTEKKALGHDLIDHDAKAPTCMEIGWDAYQTCSRCDYTTYVEKKDLGHDLIDHEAKAPTCTEIGWDAYQTCSRCDYTTYVEKKALGHDLIDHPAQAPTCTAIGWDAYQTCSRCDYTTYAEKKALGHDLIGHAAQAPTCTEIGWDAYQTCSRCDYTTYTEKKALGHALIDHEAQAPTCTAIGWDAYQTCSRCDYTTYAEKKALGHDLIDHEAQAPTCTAIGWDAYQTCSRCDYTTYTEKKALGHDLIDHEAQAPTCTAIGWDAYQTCSRCDYSTYAEKKALGHDMIDHEAQAPTCTAIGWDAYQTCSRCDYTTYAEKPALGHSEVTGTAIAPTCTDNGLTEGTYCLRCGSVLTARQVIPALGHDFAVTHRTITRVYFQCSRCRDSYWIDNAKSRNLLSSLVWNDRDENVEYTAGVAKANGIKVLTITPDAETVENSTWVSLRLKPGDVEQWKREGIGTVAFQCGEARLEISLSALTPDWFELDAPLDCYVFTLAPEDDGTLVTVEAAIGAEKAPADAYGGITLVRGDTILEIVQSGIY